MSLFLKALRGENTSGVPPIWCMRQAGRYMHAYRTLRNQYSFESLCKTPELIAEVTLQPIRRFGFDAAIIFSDILFPLEELGCHVHFPDEGGPKVHISDSFLTFDTVFNSALPFMQPIYEGITLVKEQLECPLIGFSGGPCTLLGYALERGRVESLNECKKLIYTNQKLFEYLLQKIEDIVVQHLCNQISAGCDVIQIFDTWASNLSSGHFHSYSIVPLKRIVNRVRKFAEEVPIILFLRGASWNVQSLVQTGADAFSIDHMVDILKVRSGVGSSYALQGNLDPVALFSTPDMLESHLRLLLDKMRNDPSFIFGLGLGVLPKTPEAHMEHMVRYVRKYCS